MTRSMNATLILTPSAVRDMLDLAGVDIRHAVWPEPGFVVIRGERYEPSPEPGVLIIDGAACFSAAWR